MIGFMGNNVLPAHLGELIRVFVLGRTFALSKAAVLSSVVLERILDMVFGVIQLCFWVSLRLFGVEKADAFASSIYYHLNQYVPVTLVGLYYLSRQGLKLQEIKKR